MSQAMQAVGVSETLRLRREASFNNTADSMRNR